MYVFVLALGLLFQDCQSLPPGRAKDCRCTPPGPVSDCGPICEGPRVCDNRFACEPRRPIKVIEYGPPCSPCLKNLPFQVELPVCKSKVQCPLYEYKYEVKRPRSHCTSPERLNLPFQVEVPICESPVQCPLCEYNYQVVQPPTCTSPERLNLPFQVEVPICKSPVQCPLCEYKYQVVEPPPCIPVETLKLPFQVEVPVCKPTWVEPIRVYGYEVQKPTVVDQCVKPLDVQYRVEVPARKCLPSCLCGLTAQVDRIVVPRICPCHCPDSCNNCPQPDYRTGTNNS